MARTLLLLGFCSLALAQPEVAPPPAASSPVDWRFAHPDADMRMSVNLPALLNSPSIVKAVEQAESRAQNNPTQIQLVVSMMRTVDRISLSGRQKAAIGSKAPGDMDVLVQVTGSFDPQSIAGFFPSNGASKVKVVGPHTLLIGEGDSFAAAAERITGDGAPLPGEDLEQSDIWFSASSSFLAQRAGNAAPVFQGLHGLSIGLNLGEAPEINLLLTAADDDAAGAMLKTLQAGIGQLAQLNPAASASAKALSLKQDGSRVRVHFVVPPELVAFAQQQAASGAWPAQLAPLLGSFGLGNFAPPPQDGGVKEIPAK